MTSSTLTTSVLVASEPESARPLPEPAGAPETTPRVVGVVGLGHMGTAFALNLMPTAVVSWSTTGIPPA